MTPEQAKDFGLIDQVLEHPPASAGTAPGTPPSSSDATSSGGSST
jgi:hypothetical protein